MTREKLFESDHQNISEHCYTAAAQSVLCSCTHRSVKADQQYLRYIFDESDSQLDVRKEVQVRQPGDHFCNGDEERHEHENPAASDENHAHFRHFLTSSLEKSVDVRHFWE